MQSIIYDVSEGAIYKIICICRVKGPIKHNIRCMVFCLMRNEKDNNILNSFYFHPPPPFLHNSKISVIAMTTILLMFYALNDLHSRRRQSFPMKGGNGRAKKTNKEKEMTKKFSLSSCVRKKKSSFKFKSLSSFILKSNYYLFVIKIVFAKSLWILLVFWEFNQCDEISGFLRMVTDTQI